MTKTREKASRVRQRLRQIPGELRKDLARLLRQRELFRGYVYHSRRRCGKRSCRCARGELHEAWVVATTVGGRRTTRSLSRGARRNVAALAANYREFRQARSSFRRRCQEAIGLMDELEALLCVEWPEAKGRVKRMRR